MGKDSKIEWCHHTFNWWEGCQKAGPGCDNCYAEARNKRFGGGTAINWGPGAPRRLTSQANRNLPRKWNREAEKTGIRPRVFCSSLSDVFDNAVPYQWRADLFALISKTPNLDWLLLTKRIGNARSMVRDALININLSGRGIGSEMMAKWVEGHPPQNVWIGATICNQEEADRDIPKLLLVPAEKRFLSIEPMLGPVNLKHLNKDQELNEIDCLKPYTWEEEIAPWRGTEEGWEESFEDHYGQHPSGLTGAMHAGIDWVIVGGESGPNARPMHPDWARSLRDQCNSSGVPFLFKQWGEWCPETVHSTEKAAKTALYITTDGETRPAGFGSRNNATTIQRVGKIAAGRMLDGHTCDEVPSP